MALEFFAQFQHRSVLGLVITICGRYLSQICLNCVIAAALFGGSDGGIIIYIAISKSTILMYVVFNAKEDNAKTLKNRTEYTGPPDYDTGQDTLERNCFFYSPQILRRCS